jgi:hypothetical protein
VTLNNCACFILVSYQIRDSTCRYTRKSRRPSYRQRNAGNYGCSKRQWRSPRSTEERRPWRFASKAGPQTTEIRISPTKPIKESTPVHEDRCCNCSKMSTCQTKRCECFLGGTPCRSCGRKERCKNLKVIKNPYCVKDTAPTGIDESPALAKVLNFDSKSSELTQNHNPPTTRNN